MAGAREVLQLCLYRGHLRRWIAATTGFALALHLVVTAVVIGHFAAFEAGGASDSFVICHGTADDSPTGPLELPGYQTHCVLCTLTSDTCAVIPIVTAIAMFDESTSLHSVTLRDSQVVYYASLASKYPRGPPTHAHTVG